MNTPDPKLIRSLARLRLGIAFLRNAVRGQQLSTILGLRRYVDRAAQTYMEAAEAAGDEPINILAKTQGTLHLIAAKQLCDETSRGLRQFIEVVRC